MAQQAEVTAPQIAADLDICEITVKVHRGRMMRKMNVRSLAALVDIAGRL